jgi:hypothetical protein
MPEPCETFTCSECGALYEVTRTQFPERVEDCAECVECGCLLAEWHLFGPALSTCPNPGRANAAREADCLTASHRESSDTLKPAGSPIDLPV